MLSYQHGFHAGNLADVHKHAALAFMLDYLIQKDKPLSYIETHAGRGLYDLGSEAALKTGEAAAGIARAAGWFGPAHPYGRALAAVAARYGAQAYPGSPLIAALTLREIDTLHLSELHPQEARALHEALAPWGAHVRQQDGIAAALALCPPTPRRGLMLIDPSWEVKADYETIPKAIGQLHRKWNVGVIALWYPILSDARHLPMRATLKAEHPEALCHEVRFPPVRDGHRMEGSGLFILNPPWGIAQELARLSALFTSLC
jgi:23S rRNA (adenine2030-N6)-methyltransferase